MLERLKRAQTGTAGAQIAAGHSSLGRAHPSSDRRHRVRPCPGPPRTPRPTSDDRALGYFASASPGAVWPTRWMDRDAESTASVVCLPVGLDCVRRTDVLMRICLLRLVVVACAVVHLRSETLRRRPLHLSLSHLPNARLSLSLRFLLFAIFRASFATTNVGNDPTFYSCIAELHKSGNKCVIVPNGRQSSHCDVEDNAK